MFSFKPLISCLIVGCACVVCPAFADTFVEESGLLIMEAESSPAAGDWSLQNSIGGYAGNGYLVWTGPDSFSQGSAGRGAITYRFRIQNAGNYELQWRSRITKGNNPTEHNDSWIRFPTGSNVSGEQALNGWTKVFMSTLNKWAWQSATVDHVGRRVRQYFSAGEHTIQISGRSNGHAIDRIALFHYSDVPFSASKFDSMEQSATVGTSASPPPAPAPEETAPEVEPVDEPVYEPEPHSDEAADQSSLQLLAEIYSSSAIELFWKNDASRRLSFEIRRNDELLTVNDGASYFEDGLNAGTTYRYSVTAIDSAGNEVANESVSVVTLGDANQESSSGGFSLSALSYSQSAIELFWSADELNTTPGLRFEIYLAGEFISESDGRSFFIENLTAGTDYEFSVTAVDVSGNRTDSNPVNISTYPSDSQ